VLLPVLSLELPNLLLLELFSCLCSLSVGLSSCINSCICCSSSIGSSVPGAMGMYTGGDSIGSSGLLYLCMSTSGSPSVGLSAAMLCPSVCHTPLYSTTTLLDQSIVPLLLWQYTSTLYPLLILGLSAVSCTTLWLGFPSRISCLSNRQCHDLGVWVLLLDSVFPELVAMM
jgi:hypothetical protein